LKNDTIGVNGPIQITFQKEIDKQSAEGRVTVNPSVRGKFDWENGILGFWPDTPLIPGKIYQVNLAPGITNMDGTKLRKSELLSFGVRSPEILFLSPSASPEIWKMAPDGSQKEQITDTGGKVFDYSVSPDGETIVFSAENAWKGLDLYIITAGEDKPKIILGCGVNLCFQPSIKRGNEIIAYSNIDIKGDSTNPRIWILEMYANKALPLYEDTNIYGRDATWSPNGRYLSFYDGALQGIRVVDFIDNKHYSFQSNGGLPGSWSPDSQKLLFINSVQTVMQPFVNLFEVDLPTGSINRLLEKVSTQLDISQPVWEPDANWLMLGLRYVEGSPSKQIVMIKPDGSEVREITNNQQYTHAAYSWDPLGEIILFQRYPFGVPSGTPEVVKWEKVTNQTTVVAEDGALPRWMP
jgi:TolB protein